MSYYLRAFCTGGAVPTLAAATLIGATVLLSVLAAPVSRALGETAHQALDTRGYVEAVIGTIKTASVTGL